MSPYMYLCEQYLGGHIKYQGTWIQRAHVATEQRLMLSREWRRDRRIFRKYVVVHGRTSHWTERTSVRDINPNHWLVTLADTCPYPRRG